MTTNNQTTEETGKITTTYRGYTIDIEVKVEVSGYGEDKVVSSYYVHQDGKRLFIGQNVGDTLEEVIASCKNNIDNILKRDAEQKRIQQMESVIETMKALLAPTN